MLHIWEENCLKYLKFKNFSECLNVMLGVIAAGRERREDKSNWRLKALIMQTESLSRLPDEVSVEICIINFKSGRLLKRRTKSTAMN